jgi:hypothetical protein
MVLLEDAETTLSPTTQLPIVTIKHRDNLQ